MKSIKVISKKFLKGGFGGKLVQRVVFRKFPPNVL
jgi:hypothetical protein